MMLSKNFLNGKLPSRRSITAAKRKEKKKKERLTKSLKTSLSHFDFRACMSKNDVKSDASGKKGILSCCKSLFEKIGTSLVHYRLKIPKMSKNGFLAKSSGSQRVNTVKFFCTMRCLL